MNTRVVKALVVLLLMAVCGVEAQNELRIAMNDKPLSTKKKVKLMNDNQIPDDVLNAARKKFAAVRNSEGWLQNDDVFLMYFYQNKGLNVAEFTDEGEWIRTRTVLEVEEIPANATKYLRTNNPRGAFVYGEKQQHADGTNFVYVIIEEEARRQVETTCIVFDAKGNYIGSEEVEEGEGTGDGLNDKFEASFQKDLDDSRDMGSDEEGTKKIRYSELPGNASNYVSMKYRGFKIKGTFITEDEEYGRVYLVYVRGNNDTKNRELWFDLNGKRIKYDPEVDEPQSDDEEDEEEVTVVKPTDAVLKGMKKAGPGVNNPEWTMDDDGNYIASYKDNQGNQKIVTLNEEGVILRMMTGVKPERVPAAARKTLAADYAGYKIKEAFQVKEGKKNFFRITVFNKKRKDEQELDFLPTGKLMEE